jgi:membrane-associated phospholipid phosphatase
LIVALRWIVRARLGWLDDLTLRAGLGVIVALALKDQVKWVFGRTWPETWIDDNPSYFGDGTYGFQPFTGGLAYSSFPSGHMATVLAFVAVFWLLWPRMRGPCAVLAGATSVGLLGANYHWLSDIIAGGALGTAVGVLAATIGRDTAARTAQTSG